MCRISSEYLNICLSNHILLRIIACHILLSIAIDKQLFFCDFDFYRFPISIDNKRLIISIVSDPRFDTHPAYWIFVRTTPIKQGKLPTSRVGSTLFGRVRCSYLKNTYQKFPKFWDHGSQKMCTNRDYLIPH